MAVTVAVIAACSDTDSSNNGSDYFWWQQERSQRMEALDTFLSDNAAEFESFRLAPLAIKHDLTNFVGYQMLIFRLLPELFPQYWGTADEQFSRFGLGPDPYDPDNFLPLGFAFSLPATGFADPSANYVTLSCMGCHTGGVTDNNGELLRIIGAPTPQTMFSQATLDTVNDAAFTAANIQAAIEAKPLGWFYGFDPDYLEQEIQEREYYKSTALTEFFMQQISIPALAVEKILEETVDLYTYNVPDPGLLSGMPGSLDVFSFASATSASAANLSTTTDPTLEEALPPAPAPADIPSVWKMSDHYRYQWDFSVVNLYYREVAASLTVSGGDPTAVNMDNVLEAAPFTNGLPAYPYPFDVSEERYNRGEAIYQQACASCHFAGNTAVVDPVEVGTDPNRAEVLTDFTVTSLIAQLREACTGEPECYQSDGSPYPDDEIVSPTGGYAALPLNGIWASAPYLHNGSVPTLYHLLTGDRPETFYRGNFAYDQDYVGFVWDRAVDTDRAMLYDTRKAGYGNSGHTGLVYNGGYDWGEDEDALWDLLEYLKTL
ncbi:Uncharacterised protein [Halioglobus japonicus]|nr:Uncharacterised protein [Halioglobus japonicus]